MEGDAAARRPVRYQPRGELVALGQSFGLDQGAAQVAVDKMIQGSLASMKEATLTPEDVQDLIPVKPLEEEVTVLASAYHAKLTNLMDKIKP